MELCECLSWFTQKLLEFRGVLKPELKGDFKKNKTKQKKR